MGINSIRYRNYSINCHRQYSKLNTLPIERQLSKNHPTVPLLPRFSGMGATHPTVTRSMVEVVYGHKLFIMSENYRNWQAGHPNKKSLSRQIIRLEQLIDKYNAVGPPQTRNPARSYRMTGEYLKTAKARVHVLRNELGLIGKPTTFLQYGMS